MSNFPSLATLIKNLGPLFLAVQATQAAQTSAVARSDVAATSGGEPHFSGLYNSPGLALPSTAANWDNGGKPFNPGAAQALLEDAKSNYAWEIKDCFPPAKTSFTASDAKVASPEEMLAEFQNDSQKMQGNPREIAKELLVKGRLNPEKLAEAMKTYTANNVHQAVLSLSALDYSKNIDVLSSVKKELVAMKPHYPAEGHPEGILPAGLAKSSEDQAMRMNLALLAFLRTYGSLVNLRAKCVPAMLPVNDIPFNNLGWTHKSITVGSGQPGDPKTPIVPTYLADHLQGNFLAGVAFHEIVHAYSLSKLYIDINKLMSQIGKAADKDLGPYALFLQEAITEGLATRWTRDSTDTTYEQQRESHVVFQDILSRIDTRDVVSADASAEEKEAAASNILIKAVFIGDAPSIKRVTEAIKAREMEHVSSSVRTKLSANTASGSRDEL